MYSSGAYSISATTLDQRDDPGAHPRQRRLHLEGWRDPHRRPAWKADPANAKGARGIERKLMELYGLSVQYRNSSAEPYNLFSTA